MIQWSRWYISLYSDRHLLITRFFYSYLGSRISGVLWNTYYPPILPKKMSYNPTLGFIIVRKYVKKKLSLLSFASWNCSKLYRYKRMSLKSILVLRMSPGATAGRQSCDFYTHRVPSVHQSSKTEPFICFTEIWTKTFLHERI